MESSNPKKKLKCKDCLLDVTRVIWDGEGYTCAKCIGLENGDKTVRRTMCINDSTWKPRR